MAIYLMGLGKYRFGVPNILSMDRLNRRFEYRWEPQMRIGRRPAEQFMGPGEEIIDIRGVLYPHYAGGFDQLNQMRADATIGTPYPLGREGGYYYGMFCIRSIRDEQEHFHANGDPRKVEFSIDLVNYGDEGATAAVNSGIRSAASYLGSIGGGVGAGDAGPGRAPNVRGGV